MDKLIIVIAYLIIGIFFMTRFSDESEKPFALVFWPIFVPILAIFKQKENEKLKNENENLKFELQKNRNKMNIVALDKMSYKEICGLSKDTIIFYVNECENGEELFECMEYTYQKLIGVVKVDKVQLRKIRRIKSEHGHK